MSHESPIAFMWREREGGVSEVLKKEGGKEKFLF